MESGEHMPDKKQFLSELVRLATPGGRIIIVTWCHRELLPTEISLQPKEKRLLNRINEAYYLPEWCPLSLYVKLAKEMGLEDIRYDDWSQFITPFWPAVFRSGLQPKTIWRVLFSGFTLLKATIATLWMWRGFNKGIAKFVIVTARKPSNTN